jgi:hypothetical protein
VRMQREVRGRGPEPMKRNFDGDVEVGKNGVREESSRRDKST